MGDEKIIPVESYNNNQTGYFYDDEELNPVLMGDKVYVDAGGYDTITCGVVIKQDGAFMIKDTFKDRIYTFEEFMERDCLGQIRKYEE